MQRQAVLLEHQINKERAHIRFEIKSFDPKYPETEEDNALQEINFSVKVFGTAYAFIDSSDFAAKITDSDEFIEIEPSVLKEWDFWGFATVPDIAPPGTPIIEGETPFTLTRFEVDSLFHGKSFIHFSVKILYHDFTQIQRETRAYYLWTSRGLNKQGKVIGYGSWKKIGPPEANRET